MPIEFHIQTKTGRCKDPEEPSTAYRIDCDDFSFRELNQFYIYLKHCIRYIESLIDEDIGEFTNTNLEEDPE